MGETTRVRELRKAKIGMALLALACVRQGWADINITVNDADSKPISGVSCSSNGGTTAITDNSGKLTLRNIVSVFNPQQRASDHSMLSRIPLAAGEQASLTVLNVQGRKVLQRNVRLGDRIEFSQKDRGVYFVSIASPNYSTRGRFTNLGNGITFEGFDSRPAGSLAKGAAAAGVAITCSKTGYSTQVYSIADGSSMTIDFSKLSLVPLYDAGTTLEADNIIETSTAIITRWSDRARDRHAREDQFKLYDHYLKLYWENRTATIQITDKVAKGGSTIRVDQWTQWPLDKTAREFRAFYRGIGTVAEYHYNKSMDVDPNDPLHYFTEFDYNGQTGKKIAVGDQMEIEVSQFLDKEGLEGRDNYYGTVYLYLVGKGGLVPWEPKGVFGDASTERENSHPLPEEAWLGGRTTIHQQTSDEPADVFMQLATNMAPQNGQVFVKGRRVHHTNFTTGIHDEPDNPVWTEQMGKAGPNYVNLSCTACHHKNSRAIPPAAGTALTQYVFKVGDADGKPNPKIGSVFQPQGVGGAGEGTVTLTGWTEANGLRKPAYAFTGTVPTNYSARISPQLVGIGLLEAIPESAVQALADPDDADKDGISGKMQIVTDYVSGKPRMGRFGWKAGKPDVAHQVAGALNTDIGVMTSIYSAPDCGSAQGDCGKSGAELNDADFKNLVDYISLLGVRAQRGSQEAAVQQGKALFASAGCAACHVPTMATSPYHPKAELRNQVIHPFTDLLLHDMGPGLADNLPEGLASGAEWRTAPLWNIGFTAGASGGEGYLHDGRARTVEEAILWHGGEGEAAMNKYKGMSQGDKDALVKFLKSL
jgi:CxxC motif-containing protein (DUF1111 family)